MTYSARVVLILLGVSLGAGAITGQPLYFRLAYLWAGVMIVSYLMSRLALRGVQVRRTARTLRSQVGQVFEEHYELRNTGRLPRLWIEVRDGSSLPGSHGSHVLTLVGGRESRTYLARTRLVERGVYPLGPTHLVSGDLFGLFPVQRTIPVQDSLLVYPMLVEVRSFPNPPGLLPGGEALRRRTPQITSNAAGVREYAAGDPINRIHWVSTARRDRLMVKEFELDPLADVWIFVDAARSAQVSRPYVRPELDPRDFWRRKTRFDLPPVTLEYAITSAASLARYYLQKDRAVGLTYADQSLRVLPSDRGGRQLGKILEALSLIQAEGDLPLQSVVESQARHLTRGSTAILITPTASEMVGRTVDMLLRRGLRPVTVLIDSQSFGGYFSAERVAATMASMNVPHCVIKQGDDLGAVLTAGVSSRAWS